jgi:hypothetical protein
MPAAAQLALTQPNVTDARCEALFASTLQPSDAPTADMVAEAITCTMRHLGIAGCVRQMAQQFGEHPDLAAERMRWARQLAARPLAEDRPQSGSLTRSLRITPAGSGGICPEQAAT